MSEKTDLEKLRKLWAIRGEIEEKLTAVDREIDAVLHGEEGIGSKLKRVYTAFSDAWMLRYRTKYAFTFTKDGPAAKRLLVAFGLTVEDIEARAIRFIRTEDDFFLRRRHDFQTFVMTINQHTTTQAVAAADDYTAPVGCLHSPPCRDDAQHTKRKNAEMRAS